MRLFDLENKVKTSKPEDIPYMVIQVGERQTVAGLLEPFLRSDQHAEPGTRDVLQVLKIDCC